MTLSAILWSSIESAGLILAAMAIVALIETAIPLQGRARWNRAHLGPNLALTLITFVTNAFFGAALVLALVWLQARGLGVLNAWTLPAPLPLVMLALDFSIYVAHVALHKVPSFWRYHRVHHSDPALDVSTSLRQHPGEGVVRYAFMGSLALVLGASPVAFAAYRSLSAACALLEHADIRLPRRLDDLLALVFTWPNMHKVHHSREPRLSDTNYGNVLSLWDRLFSTFTPARYGTDIRYGLDGFDDPATQTAAGLLLVPFRAMKAPDATSLQAANDAPR